MSLIAAAVFAIVRYGLALVPRLALNWPLKKIAAAVSLAVTFAIWRSPGSTSRRSGRSSCSRWCWRRCCSTGRR